LILLRPTSSPLFIIAIFAMILTRVFTIKSCQSWHKTLDKKFGTLAVNQGMLD
jgi:hypothetical protein